MLCSKLHFLLGKILHTYKGCGPSNTARYARNEALRMYDVAASWGARSLSVAEGFELDVSIGEERRGAKRRAEKVRLRRFGV